MSSHLGFNGVATMFLDGGVLIQNLYRHRYTIILPYSRTVKNKLIMFYQSKQSTSHMVNYIQSY